MRYREVTLVIDWKHGVVKLDETVQKVGIPHTARSLYVKSLVHTAKDVKIQLRREVARKERGPDHATTDGS
jgi:hypothetical protein